MWNKTNSFWGAQGGQPRVPCEGSPLRSQSHRRLTCKSLQSQVHYPIPFHLFMPCPVPREGPRNDVMWWYHSASQNPSAFLNSPLASFLHLWCYGCVKLTFLAFILSPSQKFYLCPCSCSHQAVRKWQCASLSAWLCVWGWGGIPQPIAFRES